MIILNLKKFIIKLIKLIVEIINGSLNVLKILNKTKYWMY